MLFFLVYILFVIICPSTVANVLIYFSQVLMLPSYRTILVYAAKPRRKSEWHAGKACLREASVPD